MTDMKVITTTHRYPCDMEEYLERYGWHFNRKMCDWAVDNMINTNGKKIIPYAFSNIALLAKEYDIEIPMSYDAMYVANMAKADFLGSSITDEHHLLLYIKDLLDDRDGYDELPFTRFYADCNAKHQTIPWKELL